MDIINEEYEEDENVSFIEDESEASNEEEEQEEQEEMRKNEKIIYENEEEEDYDKALELLGSTIKYYNILKYIKYKENNKYRLSSFLIGTKRHIKKKILKFYKCKNIKDLQLSSQIFSFSLKQKYDKKNLFSIIRIIPLKYFDLKIKDKKKRY